MSYCSHNTYSISSLEIYAQTLDFKHYSPLALKHFVAKSFINFRLFGAHELIVIKVIDD